MPDEPRLPDIPLYHGATELGTWDDVDAAFRDREFTMATHLPGRPSREFLDGALLVIDGTAHSQDRRTHGPLFRKAALEHYEREIILASIDRCMRELRSREVDGRVSADLVRVCQEMLCDMAVRLVGLGDLDDGARRERFVQLSALLSQGIAMPWYNGPDREARLSESRAAKDEFWREWVEPVLRERRAQLAGTATSGDDALDLLTLLLANDPDMDDGLVLRNCIMYTSGSINTTTHSVVHTVDLLRAWFAAHPARWDDRHDLAFLHAAAAEALRIHPPIPAVLRRAGHDRCMPSGREVHEGDVVALHFARVNLEEEVFGACPAEMIPARPVAERAKPYGASFGGGRHVCIGRPLALPSRADGASTWGSMVRMLAALYEAGIEVPDGADAPTPINDRGDFDRYPVVFTALARAV